MVLPWLTCLFLYRPIPPPDPAAFSEPSSAKGPRLEPGRTYENPRFIEPHRAGHLLPQEAKDISLEVVAARTVIVTIRPVPFSQILPLDPEDDHGVPPPAPPKCRSHCFKAPSGVWHRTFRQDRADTSVRWTVHLDLDSLSRAWGGSFLEVSYKAPPRDFIPRVDTSWCDSLRHIEHFLVGNLGILLEKHDDDSGTVAALDLSRAQPRSGVEILALADNGTILRRARTDSSGFARIPLGKATSVVAKTESEQAWLRPTSASSRWGNLGLAGTTGGVTQSAPAGIRILPFLAKQVHRPGEEVVASCLVRVPAGSPVGEKVTAKVEDCGTPDSVTLEIPHDGLVQWRFRPGAKEPHSTCWGKLTWKHGDLNTVLRFSVEEPWRNRGDSTNPKRIELCDRRPVLWDPKSFADLPLLREGDTLSWQETSSRAGISLVQVLQGNHLLRRFWQPLRKGSNQLRIAVDSSWDPHVQAVWTELDKRNPHDTGWRPSRRTRDFRVERTLRELPLSLEASGSADGSALRIRVKNPSSRTGSISLWVLDTGTASLDSSRQDGFPAFQHQPESVTQSWSDGLGETRRPYLAETSDECDLREGNAIFGAGRYPDEWRIDGPPPRSFCAYGYGPMAPIVSDRPIGVPFSWIPPPTAFGPGDLDVVVPLNGHRGPWVVGVVGASGDLCGRARIVVPALLDTLGRLPLP